MRGAVRPGPRAGPGCWTSRRRRAPGGGRSPLELRRLLLSGEVVALRSGEGSVCVAEAALVALPLSISMTYGRRGVTASPPLPRCLHPSLRPPAGGALTLRLRATMSGVSL